MYKVIKIVDVDVNSVKREVLKYNSTLVLDDSEVIIFTNTSDDTISIDKLNISVQPGMVFIYCEGILAIKDKQTSIQPAI